MKEKKGKLHRLFNEEERCKVKGEYIGFTNNLQSKKLAVMESEPALVQVSSQVELKKRTSGGKHAKA
jgi:hypothetical protein